MLKSQSSNPTQSSLINKPWLTNPVNKPWLNLKINTTELPELLFLYMRLYQNSLKTEKSVPLKILKPEVKDWSINSIGKRTIPPKSGVSVQKTSVQTLLPISQRESHIWTKLKNQWFHLSNGPQDKVFSANKAWEVWDSTSLTVNYTLTPFTEVEDKSCQLPEDSIMLLNYSQDQPS